MSDWESVHLRTPLFYWNCSLIEAHMEVFSCLAQPPPQASNELFSKLPTESEGVWLFPSKVPKLRKIQWSEYHPQEEEPPKSWAHPHVSKILRQLPTPIIGIPSPSIGWHLPNGASDLQFPLPVPIFSRNPHGFLPLLLQVCTLVVGPSPHPLSFLNLLTLISTWNLVSLLTSVFLVQWGQKILSCSLLYPQIHWRP